MITIVFGKPGTGKTAYLTAIAAQYLNGSSMDYKATQECISAVEQLNSAGFRFKVPTQAPVYSNYPITVPCGYNEYKSSYYIDGFHFGFSNEYVETFFIFPGSKIMLAEAQRYYNSRRSKDLPDWVSRAFEEHRHFDLDIYLDAQRPGLIDVNIREITGSFIEIQKLEQCCNNVGTVDKTVFTVREFDSWKAVDSYLNSASATAPYEEYQVEFPFNVFNFYQSKSYFRNFLPEENCDFDTLPHGALADVEKDVELSKLMYRQTPPDGFYGVGKKI